MLTAGVLQRDASGRAVTAAPSLPVYFGGGTPTNAAGALQVSAAAGAASLAGLLYDAAGSLVVADGGVIAARVPGGLPVTAAGALCVAYGGVPVAFLAGIPVDANGRVCMVSPTFVGPLDPYTAGLWAAMSQARLLTATNGLVGVRVRNSVSGVLASIGFTPSGAVDQAAIAAHCGANNGRVHTLFNQFVPNGGGHGAEFGQPTDAMQPAIYTAGAFLGSTQFNTVPTNGMFSGGVSNPAVAAYTIFFRGKLKNLVANQVLLELTPASYVGGGFVAYAAGSTLNLVARIGTAITNSLFANYYPDDNAVHCWRFDLSKPAKAEQAVLFVNGVKIARTGNADSGAVPTGTFPADKYYLGARGGGGGPEPALLDVHTVLIYTGAAGLSDELCQQISAAVAALPES